MVRAERGRFVVAIEEVGVVQARESVSLRAPLWGKVLRLVPEGTAVQVGDPVLWIDTTDLERRLERIEADVRAARSELDAALERIALQRRQAELDLARSEAELRFREQRLASSRREADDAERQLERALISQQAAEDKQRALRDATHELAQAELAHQRKLEEMQSRERQLEVERSQAEKRFHRTERRRDRMQREVEAAVLRAPSPGVVFHPKVTLWGSAEPRQVREGDQVSPWMGGLVQLPDLSTLEVRAQVAETLVARVQPGLRALVRVTALDERVVPANVRALGAMAIPRSKSEGAGFSELDVHDIEPRVFRVSLSLGDAEGLQPGMTVGVSFVLDVLADAVSVPRDAVLSAGGAPVVYVVRAGGYEERPVTLGPVSAGRVVVLEGLDGDEALYLGDPRTVDLARAHGATPVPGAA